MPNKYHRQNFDKGGGADSGRMGEIKSKLAVAVDKVKKNIGKNVIKGAMSSAELGKLLQSIPGRKEKEEKNDG